MQSAMKETFWLGVGIGFRVRVRGRGSPNTSAMHEPFCKAHACVSVSVSGACACPCLEVAALLAHEGDAHVGLRQVLRELILKVGLVGVRGTVGLGLGFGLDVEGADRARGDGGSVVGVDLGTLDLGR
eukprot:scaffold52419_cov36-Phaeocystis_antarctica.AAC.1